MISIINTWNIVEAPALIVAMAAIICAAIIFALRPLLVHYALAYPNSRSSHLEPTPQGGGIAVISAATITLAGASILTPDLVNDPIRLVVVFASILGLAVVGVTDDIRPLEAVPRLILQAIAVLVVIVVLPADLRALYILPWWCERALMFATILWFVNLVNFMDGIDWMTVAEVVPLTAGLTLFGQIGALPQDATFVALALCGAMIGFAPFNRPVARLFLGDVGSLPIGLLLGWLLVMLAGQGHFAAALLLPLYYLADATSTLLRRLINREQVLHAHRSHFYQQAIDGGFSVYQIVGRVFVMNIILVALATLTVLYPSVIFQMIFLAVGIILVSLLLWNFSHAYRR